MASNESNTPGSGGSTGRSAVPRPATKGSPAKGSASRSVDRALKAGGGRTRAQTSTSWGYYGTLIGIAVVGIGLIGQSWYSTREDSNPPYYGTESRSVKERKLYDAALKKYKDDPKNAKMLAAAKRYDDYVSNSHIHAAYGFYDCTKAKGQEWLAPINGEEDADPKGIHSHADGLMHVHPFSKTVAGRRAVVGRWFDATGIKVSSSSIFLPAKLASVANPAVVATKDQTLKAGAKCTNGKESVIKVFEYKNVLKDGVVNNDVKGQQALGGASSIPIKSGYAYVFARVDKDFVPPVPPSAKALEAPSDVTPADPAAATTTEDPTTPTTNVTASTAVGSPTTAAGTASTTAAASSSTVAPTTKK